MPPGLLGLAQFFRWARGSQRGLLLSRVCERFRQFASVARRDRWFDLRQAAPAQASDAAGDRFDAARADTRGFVRRTLAGRQRRLAGRENKRRWRRVLPRILPCCTPTSQTPWTGCYRPAGGNVDWFHLRI